MTSVGAKTLLLISMKNLFLQLGFPAFRSEVLVQFSDGSWFLVVQTLLAHHLLQESDFTRSDSVSYFTDPSVLSCRFVLAAARLLLIIDLFLSSFLRSDFSSLRSEQSAPDSVLPIEVMPISVLLCLVSDFLIGSI
jgi:hypothetical protein